MLLLCLTYHVHVRCEAHAIGPPGLNVQSARLSGRWLHRCRLKSEALDLTARLNEPRAQPAPLRFVRSAWDRRYMQLRTKETRPSPNYEHVHSESSCESRSRSFLLRFSGTLELCNSRLQSLLLLCYLALLVLVLPPFLSKLSRFPHSAVFADP